MATRQYIGARYVPKFFENPDGGNEWLNGIPYDALTIVSYADIRFISKKPVPANVGSPNNNPDYWIVSAQGGGISQDILNQINENTENVASLKTSVAKINGDVSDMQEEISHISTGKKKYVFMTNSWGSYVIDNKNYIQMAGDMLGLTENSDYYNISVGGASFAYNIGTKNYYDNLVNRNIPDKEAITDIFVFGGANDYAPADEVRTGIKRFAEYVKTAFPNARIHLAFLTKDLRKIVKNYEIGAIQEYMKISEYGGTYVKNSEYVFCKYSDFDETLFHPTLTALNYLARSMAQMVISDSIDVVREMEISVSAKSGCQINEYQGKVRMKQCNNNVYIYSYNNQSALFNVVITSPSYFNNCEINFSDTFFYGTTGTNKAPFFNCLGLKLVDSEYQVVSSSIRMGLTALTAEAGSKPELTLKTEIATSDTGAKTYQIYGECCISAL